ncbi:hypothetical protein BDQ17DRAFT_1427641 [Cyathus striatus]|nr:hypothetical protein BDQ17DRAFT_1427641 [Cyathus striatus]
METHGRNPLQDAQGPRLTRPDTWPKPKWPYTAYSRLQYLFSSYHRQYHATSLSSVASSALHHPPSSALSPIASSSQLVTTIPNSRSSRIVVYQGGTFLPSFQPSRGTLNIPPVLARRCVKMNARFGKFSDRDSCNTSKSPQTLAGMSYTHRDIPFPATPTSTDPFLTPPPSLVPRSHSQHPQLLLPRQAGSHPASQTSWPLSYVFGWSSLDVEADDEFVVRPSVLATVVLTCVHFPGVRTAVIRGAL